MSAALPVTSTLPPYGAAPGAGDVAALRAEIERLDHRTRLLLADLFSPHALDRLRRQELPRAYLLLAAGREGGASHVAHRVLADLRLYRASAWLRDKHYSAPANQRHEHYFRIMRLSEDGQLLSHDRLRKLIAKSWAWAGEGAPKR